MQILLTTILFKDPYILFCLICFCDFFPVFYYLCYEGNVNLDSITDLNERHALEVQIMEFGQIPKQVFRVPHPQRRIGLPRPIEPHQIKSQEIEDLWRSISELHTVNCFNSHKNTVSCLFISEDCSKVTSVGHDSKLKVFSLAQNKQIRSASIGNMRLSSCIQMPNVNVLVLGSWDNQM